MFRIAKFTFFIALSLSAAQESLDPDQWLREVALLITPDERSRFQALETEQQRQQSVAEFWQRRDPDPATELNEARQEHYRRLEYVEKHFRQPGHSGWRTSRGRIYVIHGEPDNRMFFPSRTERVVAPQGAGVNVDFPESEVWTYYRLQTLKGPRGQVIFFFVRGGSPSLALFPQTVFTSLGPRSTLIPIPGSAGRDFELTYVGSPLFADPVTFLQLLYNALQGNINPFDTTDLLSSVAEVERPSGDLVRRRNSRRRRFKEEITSTVFFGEVQAEMEHWFLASGSQYTYIPLAFHIAGSELEQVRELALLVELQRQGRTVASLVDRLTFEKIPPARLAFEGAVYQTRMAVLPGQHHLEAFLLDRDGKRLGRLQRTIQVPDFSRGELAVSNLILCKRAEGLKAARKQGPTHDREWLTYSPINPLQVDDIVLVPSVRRRFRRKDTLTAFLEVYRPQLKSGKPALEVQIRILQENRALGQTRMVRLDYLTQADLDKVSYAVGLPLGTLKPGRYTVQAEIRDRHSGGLLSVSSDFDIL